MVRLALPNQLFEKRRLIVRSSASYCRSGFGVCERRRQAGHEHRRRDALAGVGGEVDLVAGRVERADVLDRAGQLVVHVVHAERRRRGSWYSKPSVGRSPGTSA